MGKITGFMEFARQDIPLADAEKRVRNYQEFYLPFPDSEVSRQGARCMDCGIPFCQTGCPVDNIIPDWNDLVYHQQWRNAVEVLHSTNNFPEFTGRVCPAPCEAACTLNINNDPVTIKAIEHSIIDKAWQEGWVVPRPATRTTGKRVAVVGSGPSGLACSQQLGRAGHGVVLFEKNDRIGGLLRYGIPDFKMEKRHIDRRIMQMREEGVEFRVNVHVGKDLPTGALLEEFDAVVLTGGSEHPRDLALPGRELEGIHFAMDFLRPQNKRNAGDTVDNQPVATGKRVVVIGGGDTGSDCIGTSNRQGAASVTQIELLAKPPVLENKAATWPNWPIKLRTSSSHDEGCMREWSIGTKSFSGTSGRVEKLNVVRLDWAKDGRGNFKSSEIAGSEFEIKADFILLAMGYLHPVHEGLLKNLGVAFDSRGNVAADTNRYQTSVAKVFAAGDMRRGQSLVVWAIREGRQAARAVDKFLMGSSDLPQ